MVIEGIEDFLTFDLLDHQLELSGDAASRHIGKHGDGIGKGEFLGQKAHRLPQPPRAGAIGALDVDGAGAGEELQALRRRALVLILCLGAPAVVRKSLGNGCLELPRGALAQLAIENMPLEEKARSGVVFLECASCALDFDHGQ